MECLRESILLYVIISNKMIVKTALNIDLPRGSVRDLHLFLPFNTATFYQRHLLLEHPPQGIMISQVIWLKNIVTHYSSADGPQSNSCQAEDRRTIQIFLGYSRMFYKFEIPWRWEDVMSSQNGSNFTNYRSLTFHDQRESSLSLQNCGTARILPIFAVN